MMTKAEDAARRDARKAEGAAGDAAAARRESDRAAPGQAISGETGTEKTSGETGPEGLLPALELPSSSSAAASGARTGTSARRPAPRRGDAAGPEPAEGLLPGLDLPLQAGGAAPADAALPVGAAAAAMSARRRAAERRDRDAARRRTGAAAAEGETEGEIPPAGAAPGDADPAPAAGGRGVAASGRGGRNKDRALESRAAAVLKAVQPRAGTRRGDARAADAAGGAENRAGKGARKPAARAAVEAGEIAGEMAEDPGPVAGRGGAAGMRGALAAALRKARPGPPPALPPAASAARARGRHAAESQMTASLPGSGDDAPRTRGDVEAPGCWTRIGRVPPFRGAGAPSDAPTDPPADPDSAASSEARRAAAAPPPGWTGRRPAAVPDLSIIMPVRDAAPWLPEALESLLPRSALTLEILAVDDGSEDDGPAILDRIAAAPEDAARHPLRLLRLPRGIGQAGARNLGLAEARGRWIGFLDADDLSAGEESLAALLAEAEAAGADLCAMQFDVLGRDGLRRPGRRVPLSKQGLVDARTHPALSEISSCWQLLIRADLAREAALRFDPALRQREDRPFVVAAALAARRVHVSARVGALHRMRDGSTMTRRDPDQLAQFARHLHALAESLDRAQAGDPKPLAPYRAALETAALTQALEYWAPVVADPAAEDAAAAMLRGLAALAGATETGAPPDGPLLADRFALSGLPALPAPRDRMAAEGNADLLRALACAGRDAAARRLILDGALPWPAIAAERRGLAPNARRAAARAATFDRGRSAPLMRRGWTEAAAREALAPLHLTLHVGMPKTGSSFFQAWLEENRLTLLDRGVLVPVGGRSRARGARRDRSAGHDLWAAALMRGDAGPLIGIAAEAEMTGGAPQVILSAEALLGPALWRGPAGLRALREALPFRRVRVIGLHRDPAEWVERMYREMASNPRNGFTDPPARLLRRLSGMGLTDPEALGRALEAHFDSAAFEPYPPQGDAARRLLALAGLSETGLSAPHPRLRNPAVATVPALNVLALKRAGAAPEAIEALPDALLHTPDPEMPEDPEAPLLDAGRVRAALAGKLAEGAPLAARGCGPRQPSTALLTAALRASAAALEKARAARAPAEPTAPAAWMPRGDQGAAGFAEPAARLDLRPPASRAPRKERAALRRGAGPEPATDCAPAAGPPPRGAAPSSPRRA